MGRTSPRAPAGTESPASRPRSVTIIDPDREDHMFRRAGTPPRPGVGAGGGYGGDDRKHSRRAGSRIGRLDDEEEHAVRSMAGLHAPSRPIGAYGLVVVEAPRFFVRDSAAFARRSASIFFCASVSTPSHSFSDCARSSSSCFSRASIRGWCFAWIL